MIQLHYTSTWYFRFDESIILLKGLLGWDYQDVTFVKKNSQQPQGKLTPSRKVLSKLGCWLGPDRVLYEHFSQKFQQKVEAYGHLRMEKDVQALR